MLTRSPVVAERPATWIDTGPTTSLFEQELREAFDQAQYTPYFQAIVRASTHELCAIEALLRWDHPRRGVVTGADIVPTLARLNLLHRAGTELLALSLSRFSTWLDGGLRHTQLSFNFGAAQFSEPEFARTLESCLRDAGVDPQYLQIEITGHEWLDDSAAVTKNLQHLRWLGISLILDDFGTDYAGFSRLRRPEIRGIKLAREISAGLGQSRVDLAVARSVVRFAREAGLAVTIGGIETRHQYDSAVQLEPDHIQGFAICKPLDADEFSRTYGLPVAPVMGGIAVCA
jgi:EAL domain-containing protein (putative c-di-GMP-specific phosphodiesterase class I)